MVSSGSGAGGQPSSQFYSVLEYFKAHVTAIVTLATGALVLSISFIKDVEVSSLQMRGFLMAGWIFFTLSTTAGVCYSYILTYIASDPEDTRGLRLTFKGWLNKLSIVLHFAFMFGIICFLVFALANVGAGKKNGAEPSPKPTAQTGG
jgi:hypothetical protein